MSRSAGWVLGGGLMSSREVDAVEDVEGTVALVNGCAEDEGRECVFDDDDDDARVNACTLTDVTGIDRQSRA